MYPLGKAIPEILNYVRIGYFICNVGHNIFELLNALFARFYWPQAILNLISSLICKLTHEFPKD